MPHRTSAADLVTVAGGISGFLALAVAGQLAFAANEPAVQGLAHHTLVTCLLLYAIAMTCDILDGPVARMAGSSGLGPSLDTICDTVSFGVLPALLAIAVTQGSGAEIAVVATACVYVGATMLRLARHATADGGSREPGTFSGMPSPVGGNCVLALVVLHPPAGVLAAGVIVVAGLLVARFPFPASALAWRVFVVGLLALSVVAIAGLVPLEVPSAIALAGLLPVAFLGVMRRVRIG